MTSQERSVGKRVKKQRQSASVQELKEPGEQSNNNMMRNSTLIVCAVFLCLVAVATIPLVWYYGLEIQGSALGAQLLITSCALVLVVLQISMFIIESNLNNDENEALTETKQTSSSDIRIMLGVVILLLGILLGVLPWFMTGREYQFLISLIAGFIFLLELIVCCV